jgi:hypothetical protein
MAFAIDIDGMDALLRALDRYPEIAGPILGKASDAALLGLIPDLADYPAPPIDSRYRRSGTLGRLWTAARPEWEAIPSGFLGSIGNATPYGAWVQDSHDQAWMHKNRWSTDKEIVDNHAVDTEQYFDEALQDVADAIDAAAKGG